MNRYVEFIQDVLISVHVNLHDLHEKKGFADPDELDYKGRIVSYQEVLGILQQSAREFGVSEEEPGIEVGFEGSKRFRQFWPRAADRFKPLTYP